MTFLTDINGSARFSNYDASIAGKILKRKNTTGTVITRYVEYISTYPYDFESPSTEQNPGFVIGKYTGWYKIVMRDGSTPTYQAEVQLFNPIWSAKGNLIYYADNFVHVSDGFFSDPNFELLTDTGAGTITAPVSKCFYERGNANLLYPYFDQDYPITQAQTWDAYFNNANWRNGYVNSWETYKNGVAFLGYDHFTPRSNNVLLSQNTSISTLDATFLVGTFWNGGYLKSKGICLKVGETPTKADISVEAIVSDRTNFKEASFFVGGLIRNTVYNARAWFTTFLEDGVTEGETYYSDQLAIQTSNVDIDPIASISVAQSITNNSASFNIRINGKGTRDITEVGVCCGTTTTPTPSGLRATSTVRNTGDYESISVTGLAASMLYYARPYVIADGNTYYGETVLGTPTVQFTTGAATIVAPTVLFKTQFEKTSNSIKTSGQVTANGGAIITERGMILVKGTANPTLNDIKVIHNNSIDPRSELEEFFVDITGLEANTRYTMMAYAKTASFTGYSSAIAFTTDAATVIDTVLTTVTPSAVGVSSAVIGAILSGAITPTEIGVCYGTSINPTTSDSKKVLGSALGSFSDTITGLTAATTYNIRSYYILAGTTYYGTNKSFTTKTALTNPVLTLITPVVGSTDVTLGINVTNGGGESTLNYIAISKTAIGNTVPVGAIALTGGLGSPTTKVLLSALDASSTYNVKGFAVNSEKVSFVSGTFTTPAVVATSGSIAISPITAFGKTTATITAVITALGGFVTTAAGIIYSTSAINALTDGTKKEWVSGSSFSSNLTGLTAGTVYHVRPYLGTTLGTEVTFTTVADNVETPTVSLVSTKIQNNLYGFTIGSNNTPTNKGIVYSKTTNPLVGAGTAVEFTKATKNVAFYEKTTFYVKAYAIVAGVPYYSAQVVLVIDVVLNPSGFPMNPYLNMIWYIGTRNWTWDGEAWNENKVATSPQKLINDLSDYAKINDLPNLIDIPDLVQQFNDTLNY